jgi:glycine/D-amino acid oxidase-like deaminating enzyme
MPDSLWAHTATPRVDYLPLQSTVNADVAIVGGGFTGLSCALHLAEAGVDSIVLEAAEPGWGASGRNGGLLCPNMKITPAELSALLGSEAGRKAAEFSITSADVVMDIVNRYTIDCHADLGGWLVPAHSPRALTRLEKFARGTTCRRLSKYWMPRKCRHDSAPPCTTAVCATRKVANCTR